MPLQSRVRKFLEITEIPKTVFCKNVGISGTTLSLWLRNERDINTSTENRIIDYMTKFVKQLVEISA